MFLTVEVENYRATNERIKADADDLELETCTYTGMEKYLHIKVFLDLFIYKLVYIHISSLHHLGMPRNKNTPVTTSMAITQTLVSNVIL